MVTLNSFDLVFDIWMHGNVACSERPGLAHDP
jgi:hypothetical protein